MNWEKRTTGFEEQYRVEMDIPDAVVFVFRRLKAKRWHWQISLGWPVRVSHIDIIDGRLGYTSAASAKRGALRALSIWQKGSEK